MTKDKLEAQGMFLELIPRQEGLGESCSGDGCGAIVRVTAGKLENEK